MSLFYESVFAVSLFHDILQFGRFFSNVTGSDGKIDVLLVNRINDWQILYTFNMPVFVGIVYIGNVYFCIVYNCLHWL